MTVNLALILRVLATLLLLIAWLLTIGTFDGGNPSAWGYAGLASLAASFIP